VRVVRPLLPVEVHLRVAALKPVVVIRIVAIFGLLGLETLDGRISLDPRPIDREVIGADQPGVDDSWLRAK
jgi:hypothetical protein